MILAVFAVVAVLVVASVVLAFDTFPVRLSSLLRLLLLVFSSVSSLCLFICIFNDRIYESGDMPPSLNRELLLFTRCVVLLLSLLIISSLELLALFNKGIYDPDPSCYCCCFMRFLCFRSCNFLLNCCILPVILMYSMISWVRYFSIHPLVVRTSFT